MNPWIQTNLIFSTFTALVSGVYLLHYSGLEGELLGVMIGIFVLSFFGVVSSVLGLNHDLRSMIVDTIQSEVLNRG